MLVDFLSSTLVLANAGKWTELDRFWDLIDKFMAADQAKLNQAYDVANVLITKLAAASKP